MKLLFTADPHLNIPCRNPRTGRTFLEDLSQCLESEDPKAIVIAGDIGNSELAERHLNALRSVVGDRLMAICLGNHDFWLPQHLHSQYASLDSIKKQFWEGTAKRAGAMLLDDDIFVIGDIALVGCYGHFDLGLAAKDLSIKSLHSITEETYLAVGPRIWNDFAYIPNCASRLKEEAGAQADHLSGRLEQAKSTDKRIIVVTHTCPWSQLNGHPLTGGATDLLAAYSGNSLIGKLLERVGEVELAVCGHTHMPVKPLEIAGITALNIGADYGVFRGVVYEAGSRRLKWVGEPIAT